MRDRNAAVVAQLVELVAALNRDEADTAAGLHQLIDTGVRQLAGCQYAGITLAKKNRAVSSVAATHRYPIVSDTIQNRCGEGPCVAAARRHCTVHVDDLNADLRWPRYRRYAIERTPIRSVLSYALPVDGGDMAALSFFAHDPHAFTDDSVEVGGLFATHIALAWSVLRRRDQFRAALASRDIIGQAKGMIMERYGLDADEAFELLTRLSQQSNTRVIDIAHTLIEKNTPPAPATLGAGVIRARTA